MADISYSSGDVVAQSGTVIENYISTGLIMAGQPIYKDTQDTVSVSIASGTGDNANAYGIALNQADGDQPIAIAKIGTIDYGGGLTQGEVYVVSADNSGGIAPYSDLSTGDRVTVLGVATSTTELRLKIINSETEKP